MSFWIRCVLRYYIEQLIGNKLQGFPSTSPTSSGVSFISPSSFIHQVGSSRSGSGSLMLGSQDSSSSGHSDSTAAELPPWATANCYRLHFCFVQVVFSYKKVSPFLVQEHKRYVACGLLAFGAQVYLNILPFKDTQGLFMLYKVGRFLFCILGTRTPSRCCFTSVSFPRPIAQVVHLFLWQTWSLLSFGGIQPWSNDVWSIGFNWNDFSFRIES